MFHLSVVLKEGDIIGHCFDTKDDAMFVIHLYGDFAHMMLKASALYSGMKVIAHFVLIVPRQFAAEKGGDVFRFYRVHCGSHQFLIDCF